MLCLLYAGFFLVILVSIFLNLFDIFDFFDFRTFWIFGLLEIFWTWLGLACLSNFSTKILKRPKKIRKIFSLSECNPKKMYSWSLFTHYTGRVIPVCKLFIVCDVTVYLEASRPPQMFSSSSISGTLVDDTLGPFAREEDLDREEEEEDLPLPG